MKEVLLIEPSWLNLCDTGPTYNLIWWQPVSHSPGQTLINYMPTQNILTFAIIYLQSNWKWDGETHLLLHKWMVLTCSPNPATWKLHAFHTMFGLSQIEGVLDLQSAKVWITPSGPVGATPHAIHNARQREKWTQKVYIPVKYCSYTSVHVKHNWSVSTIPFLPCPNQGSPSVVWFVR